MTTIRRHITTSFIVSFCTTLAIFTIVMSAGILRHVMNLVSRGIAWDIVLFMLMRGIPASLVFSIPISVLTSSLLVFGRLSADGEITAMKASGIGMWQIISSPLLVAALLTLLCLHISDTVSPNSMHMQSTLRRRLATEMPLKLLDEGRMIREFVDGLTVYIKSIEGTRLEGVRIWDGRESDVIREITAARGVVHTNTPHGGLVIQLESVSVNPLYPDAPGPVSCDRWTIEVPGLKQRARKHKRSMYMTLSELVEARAARAPHPKHADPARAAAEHMKFSVEIQKRIVLSVSCLAFVLLGVPLGVTAHRKESSIGVATSLLLVFGFYLFIIAAESLREYPAVRPDLITWMPVVLAATLGWLLVRRAD